jgi:hypothetical protein
MLTSMLTRLLLRHRAALFLRVATVGLLTLASTAAQGQLPVVDAGRPELFSVAQTLPHGRSIRLESLFLAEFGAVHLNATRFRVFAEDARVWRGSVPGSLPRNVYLRGSVEGFPGSLGVNIDPLEPASEPIPAAPSGTFSYPARVAVETDWEFLDLFGGDETAAAARTTTTAPWSLFRLHRHLARHSPAGMATPTAATVQ